MTTAPQEAPTSTCPEWCANHIREDSIEYHMSEDREIGGFGIVVVSPELTGLTPRLSGDDGGVYFYELRDGFPGCSLSIPEVEAKLAELRADIEHRTAVVDALQVAIGELTSLEPAQ